MKKKIDPFVEIDIAYEDRNREIVDALLAGQIKTREALREMNKNYGNVLVKLTEIRNGKKV